MTAKDPARGMNTENEQPEHLKSELDCSTVGGDSTVLDVTAHSSPQEHGSHLQDRDEELEQIAKTTSRYSVPGIYGDLDEQDIAATRQKTRETILSIRNRRYDDRPTLEAEDTVKDDGHEYEDIDPEIVAWEGEDDPQSPRNWAWRKRAVHALLASLFTFVPPMTSSVLSPAVPAILASYHNSNETVGALMVTIMLLAWALFILVTAPLSELLGRRYVLLGSMTGGLIFNIACAVAPNTASMLVFRFLAGAFNGAPLAVAAGTIADLYDEKSRNWPMALFGIGPSCGPAIAPLFSGFLVEYVNWHWVFWVCSIVNGVVLIIGFFFFNETYTPVLLGRKAARLRKETGNPNLHTIWDISREPFLIQVRNALVRPTLFLTTNPIVFALGLHMAFVYGFMYLMLVTFPNLWTDVYHYSLGVSGLMYIALSLGICVGTLFWTPVIVWYNTRQELRGKSKPEDKLFFLPVSTVCMSVALFWYGWSAQAKIMWLMPEIGIFLFGFGIFVVFQAIQTYLVVLNTRLASSIIASVALGRTLLGGTFPLFGAAMYNRLGYGWANTIIGLLMLLLGMPAPIYIYLNGEKLRKWIDEHSPVK